MAANLRRRGHQPVHKLSDIPRDKFWNYVLYICHVGDLSLLEKLLSQYRDQPVQLNFADNIRTPSPTNSTADFWEGATPQPSPQLVSDSTTFNRAIDESYQSQQQSPSVMPLKIPSRTSSLRGRHRVQQASETADHSSSSPCLLNAMLQAAVLGSQVDIVDYLIAEFQPFLTIDDAVMYSVLLAADVAVLRTLQSHYPHDVVNYQFQALAGSIPGECRYGHCVPVQRPTTSLLEEAMLRSHLNPAYHDFAVFLIRRGASLGNQDSTSHGIIYLAVQTMQSPAVIEACLKRDTARISAASIGLAVQQNDHDTLRVMFAHSRPTREEVSDKEIMRLAAGATALGGMMPRCVRMLREYMLARQIQSRIHTTRRRMSSCRPISKASPAGLGQLFVEVAQLECPTSSCPVVDEMSCSWDNLPPCDSPPPAYTHLSHDSGTLDEGPMEQTWLSKKQAEPSEDPLTSASTCSSQSSWYREASPAIEPPAKEAPDDMDWSHSARPSRDSTSSAPSSPTIRWDKGKMASTTTVHMMQNQMRKTRIKASMRRDSLLKEATETLRKSLSSFF
ncbi:hypothetical protein MN608_07664 [Microdochium nivale]|nr:hypothetical protein MN608_07664 [Microdochium nivale]